MMNVNKGMFNAVQYFGGTVIIIGIITFIFGAFASGSSLLTPIGIGTVMGGIFIFLMGMFFIITEEVLEKTTKKLNPQK
ncbi:MULTISPECIES: hypothetical protein [Sutcliffiella]